MVGYIELRRKLPPIYRSSKRSQNVWLTLVLLPVQYETLVDLLSDC